MHKLLQHLREGISSIDDIIALYEADNSERNNSFFLNRKSQNAKKSATAEAAVGSPAETETANSESSNSQLLSNDDGAPQQKPSDKIDAFENDPSQQRLSNSRRLSNDQEVERKVSDKMDIPTNDGPRESIPQAQDQIYLRSGAAGFGDEEKMTPLPRIKRLSCSNGGLKRRNIAEICHLTAINAQLGQQYAQLRTEYVKLTADYSRLQYRHDLLKVAALKGRQVLEDSSDMGSEIADLRKKLFNSAVERESLCAKISGLQEELRQANARLHFLQALVPELQEKVLRREAVIETLMRDRELNAARDIQARMMRTELMSLKGQIRLLVRCSPYDEPRGCIDILNENHLIIQRPYEEMNFCTKRSEQIETLEVFRVFKPGCDQADVFKDVEDYIVSAVDGNTAAIIAQGPKATGKTYTMLGQPEEPGIIPRALSLIAKLCCERSEDWQYALAVGAVQIFREEIVDLQQTDGIARGVDSPWDKMPPQTLDDQTPYPRVELHDDGTSILLRGLTELEVRNEGEMLELLRKAWEAHLSSPHGGESHFIFLVRIRSICLSPTTGRFLTNCESKPVSMHGFLLFCDLASFDRADQQSKWSKPAAGVCDVMFDLSGVVLGRVLNALRHNANYPKCRLPVPFRDSKLTHLLKPALAKDPRCVLITTISLSEPQFTASYRSLKLASSALDS